jgi:hypothetical protein
VSDLNETVLPAVWSVIRRELATRPGQPRNELVARLTPSGLIRRTGADAGGVSRHVRPTITALESLGVVEADLDGGLRLSQPDLSEQAFRAEVARRLLVVPDGGDPWQVRDGSQQLEFHAELALAWLHLQGLEQPIGGWQSASTVLDQQFGVDRLLLRSDVPFNTLDRLARWLGAAAYAKSPTVDQQLLPDPTDLIRSLLPDVMPEPAMTTAEVVAEIGRRLPWLPNGTVGAAVADAMAETPDPSVSENTVPESVTLALLRLEHEGLIDLEVGDDPNRRTLLQFPDGETRGFARVIRR